MIKKHNGKVNKQYIVLEIFIIRIKYPAKYYVHRINE